MILLLGAAGVFSYLNLGRAEDPLHHQGDGGERRLAGRDRDRDAGAGRRQDREEAAGAAISRSRRELFAAGRLLHPRALSDRTPPAKVKELWYQVRKKVGDIRGSLPSGIVGPNFNDEYGDVYSALYMLSADGLTLAELKTRAEDIRQRLLRVPDVNKVDIIGERPERIFIEFSHAKLATLGLTPQQIFDSVTRQNAVVAGGSVDTASDRINLRVTGAFNGVDAIAAVPVQADGRVFRLGDIATVKRGYEDPPSFIVRTGGKPALGLGVSMQDGANIVTLGENLKSAMRAITFELPVGIEVTQIADQPQIVEHSVSNSCAASPKRSHRARRELPLARLAHRHRGRALGPARARDRVHRDVLRRLDLHRITLGALIIALGLLVDDAIIADRDDGGEDGAGLGPRARRDLRLDLDGVSDADRHAGDRRGLSPGRFRQVERRRICRRHLLGRRPGADRLVVRRGAVHALSRAEAAAGSRQARAPTDEPRMRSTTRASTARCAA